MTDQLRIFISSPGDVTEERRRAAIVIQRIRREFSRFFDISAILWEYDPMLASGTFQDVIEKPSNTDIVVLILWARLGTPLPERYKGIDGRVPVTGTEWEFEDALAANRAKGTPDLLVYRKTIAPQAAFTDNAEMAKAQGQWELLQQFWLRHFISRDGTFKAAFNQFSALDEFEQQLEMHLRALLRDRVGKLLKAEGRKPIAWHAGSPFRGLSVFGPEHAAIFFGREKAEQELVELLARRADDGAAFVLILGASGSGKSSLLRAGVLPMVESPGIVAGVARWRRLLFTPAELGADPFAGFAGRLLSGDVLPEAARFGDAVAWRRLLAASPTDAAGRIRDALRTAAQDANLTGGAMPLRLFLLVDQLEEIFTSPSFTAESRNAFAALLAALAGSGAVWVAGTMRADFFPRLVEVETLARLAAGDGAYALAPPRGPEIERMIGRPAEAAGIAFETDPRTGISLDAELLEAATAAPGALPLMEFTLDELYRRDIQTRGGDFLTFDTFRALGGLEGSIAAQAEATVAALPQAEADALPVLVRGLVLVGEDDRIGARAAPAAELHASPELAALTDALVAARLLVVSGDSIRVAHEALLRAWPRAAALIAEDRELLRVRARAEQAMHRWLGEQEAADFLLPRGRSLAEAMELLEARRPELGQDLVRFIESSAAADEARRQAELAAERARAEAEAEAARQREQRAVEQAEAARRLTRRTRIAAAILSVLLLVAVGAGIFALIQRNQAVRQRNAALVAQSHFLADAASAAIESGDTRLGRLLALTALPKNLADPDRPYVHEAEAALAQSWPEDRLIAIEPPPPPAKPAAKPAAPQPPGPYAKRAQLLLSVIPNSNLSFTFSPQGDRTAVAGEGHARVYDLQSNVLLDVPHRADKGAMAFDQSGRFFAQGEGNAVRLWDVDAKASRLLGGLAAGDAVLKLAFAPDGKTLLAGGKEGGVVLFAMPQGTSTTLPGVSGETYDIRISADSRHAVVTGADGRATLYDLTTAKPVGILGEAAQAQGDIKARSLRQGLAFLPKFSPDGTLVVTATGDTRVQIWDAATAKPVGAAMAHAGAVQSFDFNKDRLEVNLLDGRKYIWATHAPGEAKRIWPAAKAISLSPDGSEILITDAAGLYVINAAGRRLRTLMNQPGLSAGAVSPDGKNVVVTVNDTEAAVLPFAGGNPRIVYRAPAGDKIGMADFTSNSGRLIVETYAYLTTMIDPVSGRAVGTIADGKQDGLGFIAKSDAMVAWWGDGRAVLYNGDGGSVALDMPKDVNLHTSRIIGNGEAGLLASVGRSGSAVFFWDMKTGKLVGRADDRQSFGAFAAAFQPGPRGWIARGGSNQEVLVWAWPQGGLPDIVGAPLKRLLGHTGIIRRMRLTPQGRLETEGDDHAAILWDPLHGHAIARYDGVMDSRLAQDGSRFVFIGADGAVRMAQLPPAGQALLDDAARRYGSLSPAERDRYFLSAEINRH
ncbi:MAG: AAA family ATPase [Alphaproteobacteria bacterium]|nr:AAA family ATPase [Alphaproteobacteria bacterium]